MNLHSINTELKNSIYIALGIAVGHLFKEELRAIPHLYLLIPLLFGVAVLSHLYRKHKAFRNRTFISTKFDIAGRVIKLLLAAFIAIAAIYYWTPNSLYNYWYLMLIAAGCIALISGTFYEKTIQLYETKDLLTIEYVSKGKYELHSVDSYELRNGTLYITSGDRRVEVYNIKMSKENTTRLINFLNRFKA